MKKQIIAGILLTGLAIASTTALATNHCRPPKYTQPCENYTHATCHGYIWDTSSKRGMTCVWKNDKCHPGSKCN